ncbi:MAG: circadian clock KaiB family protein [Nitriliruptoraceae bacterium]|nr:circadian clock KaiB family protein [Nitriliruptoraceae bacterium]
MTGPADRPPAVDTAPDAVPDPGGDAADDADFWHLRLYVAGQSPRSLSAYSNLSALCEQHLAGRYAIEVIDLEQQPSLARTDDILAVPTLVRRLPAPLRRIIGDLSDADRVRIGLRLQPPASG